MFEYIFPDQFYRKRNIKMNFSLYSPNMYGKQELVVTRRATGPERKRWCSDADEVLDAWQFILDQSRESPHLFYHP